MLHTRPQRLQFPTKPMNKYRVHMLRENNNKKNFFFQCQNSRRQSMEGYRNPSEGLKLKIIKDRGRICAVILNNLYKSKKDRIF